VATLMLKHIDLELLEKQCRELRELVDGKREDYDALQDVLAMFDDWFDNQLEPVTVAVVVEGGLLQAVVADESIPGLQILWIDYDTEGADDEDIIIVPQLRDEYPTAEALAATYKVMPAGIDINQTIKNIEENDAIKRSDYVGEIEIGSDAAGNSEDQTGDGPVAAPGSHA